MHTAMQARTHMAVWEDGLQEGGVWRKRGKEMPLPSSMENRLGIQPVPKSTADPLPAAGGRVEKGQMSSLKPQLGYKIWGQALCLG